MEQEITDILLAIEEQPFDHRNYNSLIEVLVEQGNYQQALTVANDLLELFEPEPSAQTIEFLGQDPVVQLVELNESYNGQADTIYRIELLKAAVADSNIHLDPEDVAVGAFYDVGITDFSGVSTQPHGSANSVGSSIGIVITVVFVVLKIISIIARG